MILVDTSVWIDFFRGDSGASSTALAQCLGDASVEVGMADLVLFEVTSDWSCAQPASESSHCN